MGVRESATTESVVLHDVVPTSSGRHLTRPSYALWIGGEVERTIEGQKSWYHIIRAQARVGNYTASGVLKNQRLALLSYSEQASQTVHNANLVT